MNIDFESHVIVDLFAALRSDVSESVFTLGHVLVVQGVFVSLL